MMKKTILYLVLVVLVGQSNIYAQEESLIETDIIQSSGFCDVKTTDFNFKKVDENHRIVAFTKEDLINLEAFFNEQQGVLSVEGDYLDKTIQVLNLSEQDGKTLFDHCEIAEILNRDGYITIRLRSRIKSQYLLAVVPTLDHNSEMTAELTNKEKLNDCNECGDVKISQEALDLLKGMDFGGDLFNISTDSTDQSPKPLSDMK
ncbi:MAG: hypothetical protein AB8B69_15920 [Chitinophagales bacterium]